MSMMKKRMQAYAAAVQNPKSAHVLATIVYGVIKDIRTGAVPVVERLTEHQSVLDFMQVGDFECSPTCIQLLCGAAHGRLLQALAKQHKVMDHLTKYPEVLMVTCASTQHITEQAIAMVLAHYKELKPNAVFDEALAESYSAKIRNGI